MTNKSTNPLIQNNFVLKKLEVGLEQAETTQGTAGEEHQKGLTRV